MQFLVQSEYFKNSKNVPQKQYNIYIIRICFKSYSFRRCQKIVDNISIKSQRLSQQVNEFVYKFSI